jgi:hypothetical protein
MTHMLSYAKTPFCDAAITKSTVFSYQNSEEIGAVTRKYNTAAASHNRKENKCS